MGLSLDFVSPSETDSLCSFVGFDARLSWSCSRGQMKGEFPFLPLREKSWDSFVGVPTHGCVLGSCVKGAVPHTEQCGLGPEDSCKKICKSPKAAIVVRSEMTFAIFKLQRPAEMATPGSREHGCLLRDDVLSAPLLQPTISRTMAAGTSQTRALQVVCRRDELLRENHE